MIDVFVYCSPPGLFPADPETPSPLEGVLRPAMKDGSTAVVLRQSIQDLAVGEGEPGAGGLFVRVHDDDFGFENVCFDLEQRRRRSRDETAFMSRRAAALILVFQESKVRVANDQ